jgi:uncharacterized protein (TIGR03435 family)
MNRTMRIVSIVLAVAFVFIPFSHAQAPAQKPAFEVVSVKAANSCPPSSSSSMSAATPGRVSLCNTLFVIIRWAYLVYNKHVPNLDTEIQGGPPWITSDLYEIAANTEGDRTRQMMLGPMTQRLLEERFRLNVHYEEKEMPIYALTAAKSGTKLQKFIEGSCMPMETFLGGGRPLDPLTPPCGVILVSPRGNNLRLDAYRLSLEEFSRRAKTALRLDRPVIDQTSVEGIFNFHLDFAPSRAFLGPSDAPSIFTALQEQLGLKMESSKGPVEVLVVDSVQRPSEN